MRPDQVYPLMSRWMTPAVEEMTGQGRWLVSGDPGRPVPVDLSDVAVRVPQALSGKLKCGAEVNTVLGTGGFQVLADRRGVLERAVVLGRSTEKQSVAVPVNRKAKRVLVLHGTTMQNVFAKPTYYSYHRGPAELIRYQVTYADGKRASFSACYKDDIGDITAVWPEGHHCFQAVPVEAGRGHTLYAREWVNPRPKVAIKRITIRLGADATDFGHVLVAGVATVA